MSQRNDFHFQENNSNIQQTNNEMNNKPLNQIYFGAQPQSFNPYFQYPGQIPNQLNNNYKASPVFQPSNFSNPYQTYSAPEVLSSYNIPSYQVQPIQTIKPEIPPELSLKIQQVQEDQEYIQNNLEEDSNLLLHLNFQYDILFKKINILSSQE